jgi:uncharacterized damage-inducible protein DinB
VSVTEFYAGWARYQVLLSRAIRAMPEEELALTAPFTRGNDHWPIWAIAAHVAGARVYWLCLRFGEPGIETTRAFMDPGTFDAWEDDLSKPRTASEVADALDTSWAVCAAALERWTPELLAEPVAVPSGDGVVHHTRQGILLRLITHDAYHAGEIALIQGAHGLPQLDLWPAGFHTIEGMAG